MHRLRGNSDARPVQRWWGSRLRGRRTGSLPFDGLTVTELVRSIREVGLPPLGSVRPDVPRAFSAAVDRAVSRDPAERFASAVELLEALEAVQSVFHSFDRVAAGTVDDDAALVSASFARLHGRVDAFFAAVYDALFRRDPSLRVLFPVDLAELRAKLASTIRLAIESLRTPESLVPILEDLGRRHVDYGVLPRHLQVFGETLLEALATFDAESWDAPHRRRLDAGLRRHLRRHATRHEAPQRRAAEVARPRTKRRPGIFALRFARAVTPPLSRVDLSPFITSTLCQRLVERADYDVAARSDDGAGVDARAGAERPEWLDVAARSLERQPAGVARVSHEHGGAAQVAGGCDRRRPGQSGVCVGRQDLHACVRSSQLALHLFDEAAAPFVADAVGMALTVGKARRRPASCSPVSGVSRPTEWPRNAGERHG